MLEHSTEFLLKAGQSDKILRVGDFHQTDLAGFLLRWILQGQRAKPQAWPRPAKDSQEVKERPLLGQGESHNQESVEVIKLVQ